MNLDAAVAGGQIPPHNETLDTSTQPAAARWDDLLTLQTDLFFQHELDGFRANADWLRAASVLDVGCGNGYYISRLAACFPERRYTGLDTSPALIANAKARPEARTISFMAGDYFAYEPNGLYDAILMRFVVQHLTDMAAILRKTTTLLSVDGSLFIIEPDLTHSTNLPATPLFMDMLSAYDAAAAAKGRIRAQLSRLPSLVQRQSGWEVASDRRLSVPNAGPFSGKPLASLFAKWIDLCEHAAQLPCAYDAIRKEIEDWGRRADSFSQVCLRLVQLKHVVDGTKS